MTQYSIGAVSKLTGVPAHTLRKWESRHGIAAPLRSSTGRRVYTEAHVNTLKTIKHLIGAGHALGHLAELDDEGLQELASQHAKPERPAISAVSLVGPNLARLLPNQRIVSQRFSGSLNEWMAQLGDKFADDPVAVESETIPASALETLLQLRGQVARLVVVYSFAPSQTLAKLKAADISVVRAPVSGDELLLHLASSVAESQPDTRSQRFSTQELARVAAINPAIECECPNHIAKLLMDIASFEKYSSECEDTDRDAKALHSELAEISAQARVLFEDALISVATAEGIELKSNH